ncbi:protein FAM192A-like [Notothenia coriiceps]|uniref:Protein FAM192A-like n=1 Tax=Notothenia coriiceps TaxID=8208 RepID=A0A6I9P3I0_9TELE|nr:PREDICTED: protein FAM192A-like [Notothenia coriiceps]
MFGKDEKSCVCSCPILLCVLSTRLLLFITLTQGCHSAIVKHATTETRREPEKKLPSKAEQRTSHLSQAHLLAGAVKRRSSSQSSDSSKKQKVEITKTGATGNGDRQTEQKDGAGGAERAEVQQTALMAKTTSAPLSSERGVLHLPSAAVCVGVLPGLCVYSGSSDSDSSSDSEV